MNDLSFLQMLRLIVVRDVKTNRRQRSNHGSLKIRKAVGYRI